MSDGEKGGREQLESLRREVRRVDSGILDLVAERMALVQRIGEVKKGSSIPLRDFSVEKEVLEASDRRARERSLSPELARRLMRLLIVESVLEQERLHYSAYSGDAERVLVVGGLGTMGRWLARFFANQGHEVLLHDRAPQAEEEGYCPALEEGLRRTSLAVVATPLEVTGEVIERIARIGYDGVVFDVASLKGHLRPALFRAREAGVAVTSIHPMFGATARTLADKVICLCDCGDAAATARVEALFRETAATLVHLTIEDHDRIVSQVLGLSHLLNIAFAATLVDGGLPLATLQRVGSTTFASQLVTTASVVRENPDLYYSIQRCNPHSGELYDSLATVLERITGAVGDGDRGAFVRVMTEAREWLEGGEGGSGVARRL